MPKQQLMYAVFALYAPLLYLGLVLFTHHSQWWWVVLLALLASPVTLAFLACRYELLPWQSWQGRLRQALDPSRQSWAFLADVFGLTPAFAIAAHGWQSVAVPSVPWMFLQWWWWLLAAPVVGVAASMGFHFFLDRQGYLDYDPSTLRSPTKVWHNFCAYPILFSAGVAVLVPYGWVFPDWHSWAIAGLVLLVWGGGGVRDALVGLDVRDLHVPWDAVRFRRVVTSRDHGM